MEKKGLLVGITGGMGAGKSALATFFREKGYPVFSADELARELVVPGSPALAELTALFGPGALLPDGTLDRAKVRGLISESPELRLRLEGITHPRIQARAAELAGAALAGGAELVFYEAPLLFEAKGGGVVDAVICVHAPHGTRIARVLSRDGGSREGAERLEASQLPQEEKMRRSDYLVENNGDPAALRARGELLLQELLRRARG